MNFISGALRFDDSMMKEIKIVAVVTRRDWPHMAQVLIFLNDGVTLLI